MSKKLDICRHYQSTPTDNNQEKHNIEEHRKILLRMNNYFWCNERLMPHTFCRSQVSWQQHLKQISLDFPYQLGSKPELWSLCTSKLRQGLHCATHTLKRDWKMEYGTVRCMIFHIIEQTNDNCHQIRRHDRWFLIVNSLNNAIPFFFNNWHIGKSYKLSWHFQCDPERSLSNKIKY